MMTMTQEIANEIKKEDFPNQVRKVLEYIDNDLNVSDNKDIYLKNFKDILIDLKEADSNVKDDKVSDVLNRNEDIVENFNKKRIDYVINKRDKLLIKK